MSVELRDVISLPDPLLSDHFDLNIPNPPGGGSGQALLIRNMTAVLPGRSNSTVPVVLHRHKVNYAGRRQFPGTFQAQFIDSKDKAILELLRKWQDRITDPVTGLPKYKSQYASTGCVTIYDAGNVPVEQRTFMGLWPSNVADIPLNGGEGAGSPVQVTVTFTYDFWKPGGF